MSSIDDQEHQATKELVLQEDKEDNNTSPSSSPEFSFTVSLRPCDSSSDVVLSSNGKAKSSSLFAVDLSPADDIFFHGHLLPLQILSHLPISPHSSTDSSDGFSLPKERFDGQIPQEAGKNRSCSNGDNILHKSNGIATRNNRTNPRFWFTLSSFLKRRKGSEPNSGEKEKKASHHKRRPRFELNRVLRRCASVVKQAALFHGRSEKEATTQFAREAAYRSYSGNLNLRHDTSKFRGNRDDYSAPVSTRTSPTNSGLLVPIKRLSSSTSDSSVEELQAAIEAAIAHCKNSFAVEKKS